MDSGLGASLTDRPPPGCTAFGHTATLLPQRRLAGRSEAVGWAGAPIEGGSESEPRPVRCLEKACRARAAYPISGCDTRPSGPPRSRGEPDCVRLRPGGANGNSTRDGRNRDVETPEQLSM